MKNIIALISSYQDLLPLLLQEEFQVMSATSLSELETGIVPTVIVIQPELIRQETQYLANYKNIPLLLQNSTPQELKQQIIALIKHQTLDQEVVKLTTTMDSLLYTVSHDLKAPVRWIDGFSRLLLKQNAEQLDEKGQKFLEQLIYAAKQLNLMIQEILTLSRLRRHKLVYTQVSVNELIQEVLKDLELQIQKSQAQITVQANLPELNVDRSLFFIVFKELISNALTYGHKAEEVPIIEISSFENEDPSLLNFSITDRGIGIQAANRERVFQLFQRLVKDESEHMGGGLTMVKQIMELHAAEITIREGPEGGANFILSVPKRYDSQ